MISLAVGIARKSAVGLSRKSGLQARVIIMFQTIVSIKSVIGSHYISESLVLHHSWHLASASQRSIQRSSQWLFCFGTNRQRVYIFLW